MARNPFKPSAGANPPMLIGRERSLELFREGLEDGAGAPGLLTIFTGPRGVGKTVMLTEAEKAATQAGWAVVSDTATSGLINRITRSAHILLDELSPPSTGRETTGISGASNSTNTQLPPTLVRDLRTVLTELTKLLNRRETGLVITVDEIHAVDRAELLELATVVQHLIRERLPISLLVAGVPRAVSDLLNEQVANFLRRADRVDLRDVLIRDVENSFAQTFQHTGVLATRAQMAAMAEATEGYPFLIQLVGYNVWRRANDGTLTDDDVIEGIEAARQRLGATVLQASLSGLSPVDRTFLLRMAEDDGPSRLRDVAHRMSATSKYAGAYRRRLIDSGVVVEAGHGLVDFAIPTFREYLREHADRLTGYSQRS